MKKEEQSNSKNESQDELEMMHPIVLSRCQKEMTSDIGELTLHGIEIRILRFPKMSDHR